MTRYNQIRSAKETKPSVSVSMFRTAFIIISIATDAMAVSILAAPNLVVYSVVACAYGILLIFSYILLCYKLARQCGTQRQFYEGIALDVTWHIIALVTAFLAIYAST